MGIRKYRTANKALKKEYIGARFHPELLAKLAQYCDENGKNASQVVREAIELYIEKNMKNKGKKTEKK